MEFLWHQFISHLLWMSIWIIPTRGPLRTLFLGTSLNTSLGAHVDTFRVELVERRGYSLGKCCPTIFQSHFFQNTLFYTHSSSWEFPLLHWPWIGILSLFSISHSSGCLVVSHCGFNVHFPGNRQERALLQLLAIWMLSFVKCPFESLCPFL